MSARFLETGGTTSSSYDYHSSLTGYVSTNSRVPSINYKYTRGVNTPNYRTLLKRGEILPYTPFEQKLDIGAVSGSFRIYENVNPSDQYFNVGNDTMNISPLIPDVDSMLAKVGNDPTYFVQAAASRIFTRNSHDTLTFIAELRRSISTFRVLGFKLIDLLRIYNSPSELARAWLEVRYRWRPLFYDAVDLVDALNHLESKRDRFTEMTGTSYSLVETSTTTDVKMLGGSSVTQTGTLTDSWKISVRGSVTADIKPPSFRFDPIVTLWEILPYSFVYDWFVNVGQALEALNFLTLQKDYAAGKGWQITLNRTYSMDSFERTGWTTISASGYGSVTSTLTKRVPSSVSSLPLIKVRLDPFKLLDLITLVKSFRDGKSDWVRGVRRYT